MGPLDLLFHLLNFAAPALVVGLLLALCARLAWPGGGSVWTHAGLNALAGVAVLAAGLWYFGRDGKMATYAALVGVAAFSQWLLSRGWK
ncbi:MAG TPA: hypothetical protein VLJ58_04325 [Ramlibacter sp.]|nr:hypothetical protein [Ramlibacter sp.]